MPDMTRSPALGSACLLVAMLAVGCMQPPAPLEHQSLRLTVSDENEQRALWDTTLDVLRRSRFQIDRDDPGARVITTFPEVSGNWFEFWRQDTATAYDTVEANLHTVRREATVNLVPADSENTWLLSIKVVKSRHSAPERQMTNPAEGLRVFSAAIPTTSGDVLTRAESVEWIDRGRDAAVERMLLDRVLRCTRRIPPSSSPRRSNRRSCRERLSSLKTDLPLCFRRHAARFADPRVSPAIGTI